MLYLVIRGVWNNSELRHLCSDDFQTEFLFLTITNISMHGEVHMFLGLVGGGMISARYAQSIRCDNVVSKGLG